MHNFSNLLDKVHVSDRSTVHHQEYLNTIHAIGIFHASSVGCLLAWSDHASRQPTELAWQIPIACIHCWDTPDDGQSTCPKRV